MKSNGNGRISFEYFLCLVRLENSFSPLQFEKLHHSVDPVDYQHESESFSNLDALDKAMLNLSSAALPVFLSKGNRLSEDTKGNPLWDGKRTSEGKMFEIEGKEQREY